MNKKQLLIALCVFAAVLVIGGTLVLLESSAWKSTTSEKGRKVLENYDVNKIENIKIRTADSVLTIQKKNTIWVLPESNDYPADFNMIREMIDNVWNMKIAQKTKLNKENLAKLDLLEPGKGANSGTLLEFFDRENKKITALILGKQHFAKSPQEMPSMPMMNKNPDGRYVALAEKPETVYLIAEPFEVIQPTIPLWRSKENLKIENINAISFSPPKSSNVWKLSKKTETDNFALDGLKKGELTDDTQSQLFIQNLISLNISDVLPYSKLAESGLDSQDVNVLSVSSFDNFNYTIKIAQKNGKYFMKYDVAFNPESEVDKQFASAAEQDAKKTEEKDTKDDQQKAKSDNEKRLKSKFSREKMLSQWIYVIPEKTATALLNKVRNDFLKKGTAAPEKADKKSAASAAKKPAAPATPPADNKKKQKKN